MIYLCCTKKLCGDLQLQTEEPLHAGAGETLLGNWYVHVIRILRRKCILFVNERTLFSFITFDFSKARLNGLNRLFADQLNVVLQKEQFSEATVRRVLDEVSVIKYGRATNRRVLGNLNELVGHYRYYIERNSRPTGSGILPIIKDMNRMPQRNIGWKYSIEILTELLTSVSGVRLK